MVKIQIVLTHTQWRVNFHFASDLHCPFTEASTINDLCMIVQIIYKYMFMDRYPVVSCRKEHPLQCSKGCFSPWPCFCSIPALCLRASKRVNLIHDGTGYTGYRIAEKSNRGWWGNQDVSNSVKLLPPYRGGSKGRVGGLSHQKEAGAAVALSSGIWALWRQSCSQKYCPSNILQELSIGQAQAGTRRHGMQHELVGSPVIQRRTGGWFVRVNWPRMGTDIYTNVPFFFTVVQYSSVWLYRNLLN